MTPPPGDARNGAAEVLARCAELDAFTAAPDRLERVYLTPEHAGANRATAAWMSR